MGCAVTGSAGGVQCWPALRGEHSRERTGQTPGLGRAQAALPPRHVVGIRNDDQLGVGDDGGPLLLPHRLQGGGKAQRLVPCTLALRRGADGCSRAPWSPGPGRLCPCTRRPGRAPGAAAQCVRPLREGPHSRLPDAFLQQILFMRGSHCFQGSERRGSDKHVRL